MRRVLQLAALAVAFAGASDAQTGCFEIVTGGAKTFKLDRCLGTVWQMKGGTWEHMTVKGAPEPDASRRFSRFQLSVTQVGAVLLDSATGESWALARDAWEPIPEGVAKEISIRQ